MTYLATHRSATGAGGASTLLLCLILCLTLLMPQSAEAHFQNFLARMLYLQEEGDDSLIYLRLPLAALLLPSDWEQNSTAPAPPYTQLDEQGRPHLDLTALVQSPTLLRTQAASYLQIGLDSGARGQMQVEALRIQAIGERAPFGYLPAIKRALVTPLQLPDRALLLEEAIIDIKLRLPGIRAQAIQQLASPADEWPLIRARSVNIVNLPDGQYSSNGPLQLTVHRPPSALDTLWQQLESGVHHVLIGLDHVLFMAVLVLSALHWRRVIHNSLMFTAGHSITLGLVALGWLTLPEVSIPLIETLIALSVLYGCIRLLLSPRQAALPLWQVAAIGLLHGLGFANVMQAATGLPIQQLLLQWAGFNLGIELGQLLVMAALGTLLILLQKSSRVSRRQTIQALSYPSLLVAVFWSVQRGVDWLGTLGLGA